MNECESVLYALHISPRLVRTLCSRWQPTQTTMDTSLARSVPYAVTGHQMRLSDSLINRTPRLPRYQAVAAPTRCVAAPHCVNSLASAAAPPTACSNITWHEGAVNRRDKEKLLNQRGCVLWFTGLSGSGKSTVACTLEHALVQRGHLTTLLDGDNVRHGLNNNLGFSQEDREENIRRIGEVSKLLVESGLITLASFISPYERDRAKVRARLAPGDFIEVYMKTPLAVCERRDPKGLYQLARAGKLKGFTGIDDPYEVPCNAEIVLESDKLTVEAMAAELLIFLDSRGFLSSIPRVDRCAQFSYEI